MVKSLKSSTHKLGICIRLNFTVNQHSRDAELIKGLVKYLGCGKYYPSLSLDQVEFRVSRNTEIGDITLFFERYPLQSAKLADFANFNQVAGLIKEKAHLTEQGIKEILLQKQV